MMHVIVPKCSIVLTKDHYMVGELEIGDKVNVYDMHRGRVESVPITGIAEATPDHQVNVAFNLKNARVVTTTSVLTTAGERIMGLGRRNLRGYCKLNPKQLLNLEVNTITVTEHIVDTVMLTWPGSGYLWLDGLLVGTNE